MQRLSGRCGKRETGNRAAVTGPWPLTALGAVAGTLGKQRPGAHRKRVGMMRARVNGIWVYPAGPATGPPATRPVRGSLQEIGASSDRNSSVSPLGLHASHRATDSWRRSSKIAYGQSLTGYASGSRRNG
jgi:hypothetical protein